MIYGVLVFYFYIVNELIILYKYFFIVCFFYNFQIDFINRIKIIVLLVLLVGDDNIDYVINFMVQYSNDGVFWIDFIDNIINVKVI